MKVLLQRVRKSWVTVQEKRISSIDNGYTLLVCFEQGDTAEGARRMARKIAQLRIMADSEGKMNKSIMETNGSILVVSQFTLAADTRKGNRPSFIKAAAPSTARQLLQVFITALKIFVPQTVEGEFGSYMQVFIQNDGPVTIWFDSER